MAGKGLRPQSAFDVADAIGRAAIEPSLTGATLGELEAEVRRRKRTLSALHTERVDLIRRLKVLEKQIKSLGGDPPDVPGAPSTGVRPRNRTNLVDSLAALLDGRTMTVMEAVDAVQRAGYRTTSPNFRIIVNQALLANPDRFEKVARGRYRTRPSDEPANADQQLQAAGSGTPA